MLKENNHKLCWWKFLSFYMYIPFNTFLIEFLLTVRRICEVPRRNLVPFLGFSKFIVQVALLKYTKTFIKTILYNFNNSIVCALNFNILKTNLSKIASKEVKILCFWKLFSKKKELCSSYRCWTKPSVALPLAYFWLLCKDN